MKCPIDGTELVMSDRNGIEIDYCPQCRGVWLDRGELDKIIERSTSYEQQLRQPPAPPAAPQQVYPTQQPPAQGYNPNYRRYDDDYDDDDYYRRTGQHKPKRKGFLGEMFDIFD
jgi:uncharacterized protein